MRTQREVFNKLFKEEKTELAAEKVELGAIEDLVKVSEKAQQVAKNGLKIVEEYETILKKAQKVKDDVEKSIRELRPVKTKVFQEAKALGGSIFNIAKNTPEYKNSISIDAELSLILGKLSKL